MQDVMKDELGSLAAKLTGQFTVPNVKGDGDECKAREQTCDEINPALIDITAAPSYSKTVRTRDIHNKTTTNSHYSKF